MQITTNIDYLSELELQSNYWSFIQSHPNHITLPPDAKHDAEEAILWSHAGQKHLIIDIEGFADTSKIAGCLTALVPLSKGKLLKRCFPYSNNSTVSFSGSTVEDSE